MRCLMGGIPSLTKNYMFCGFCFLESDKVINAEVFVKKLERIYY